MRILHTSDWHLGKHLELMPRLDEQRLFLDELVQIADDEKVDLILVAGDIYDTGNPPAEAERLFYSAIKRLGMSRPVIVVAGNHDSPERLSASGELAAIAGVIIAGLQKYAAPTGDYGSFSVVRSGDGFVELSVNGENAVVLNIPFPSERRLNELFINDAESFGRNYSEKVGDILNSLAVNYRDDTINIAVGHFFVSGGEAAGSERESQVGGSYAVDAGVFPDQAQYIALGHLHRSQSVTSRTYYSGSPIQYSKKEAGQSKCVLIADIHPSSPASVKKVLLKNYKPVEVWKAGSIEEALCMCEARSGENCWVFLEIQTDRVLLPSEIKELRNLKQDIVEILPVLAAGEQEANAAVEEQKSIGEEFSDFYKNRRGAAPSEELVKLFMEICGSMGEDAP